MRIAVRRRLRRQVHRTDLREPSKQGLRPLAVGVIGEFAIAALTLVMAVAAARSILF